MRRLVASAFVSLDGVIQAPGGPSEDWTGGFAYGGWLPPFFDEVAERTIGDLLHGDYELLLGRKTYEIFAAFWPYAPAEGPDAKITGQFNRTAKHVLTRNPDQPLDWANSHRLAGIDDVATLKRSEGPDLIVQGSGTLCPALLGAGLLDRLVTLTFPVVLGQGKRLFGDGTPARTLTLVEHRVSPNGIVIAHYEPAGEVAIGDYAGAAPSEREQARQERMKREG